MDACDFDPDLLAHLLMYMYTGNITIAWNQLSSALNAASTLLLVELKEICIEYLMENLQLQPENCFMWMRVASKQGIGALQHYVSTFMCTHFVDVTAEAEFKELNYEELRDYVKDDKLQTVPCNDKVLGACLNWVNHDVENRTTKAEELISCVKLEGCSAQFLKDIFKEHEELLSSPKTQKQLIMALMDIATAGGADRTAEYQVVRHEWDVLRDPDPLVCTCDETFIRRLLTNLRQMLNDKVLVDFSIKVNTQSYPCHRLILRAMCPYFAALFSAGLQEAQDSCVHLADMDEQCVGAVVDFLYSGAVEVPWVRIGDFIEVCEYLQLSVMKPLYTVYVMGNIGVDNCLTWYKFSGRFMLDDIRHKATHVLCSNFTNLCSSDSGDMWELEASELINILTLPDLDLRDSDALVSAAFRWVNYDLERRRDSLVTVLGHINMENCTEGLLEAVTLSEEGRLFTTVLDACPQASRLFLRPLMVHSRRMRLVLYIRVLQFLVNEQLL